MASFPKHTATVLSGTNGSSRMTMTAIAAPALTMTQRDGQMAVSRVLQATMGYGKRAAREIAEAARCNERTALDWVNGVSTPDFLHTLRLMASIPEFAAECRRLAGLVDHCHPELQRDLNQLLERWGHCLASPAEPEEGGSEAP